MVLLRRFSILLLCLLPSFPMMGQKAVLEFLRSEYNLPVHEDGSVVLLPSGREKFDDLFAAVRGAKHSIHLEYFNFRGDSISALLFDLLREKVAEGVEVRALFDGFGNSSNDRPLRHARLDTLRSWGIEIRMFDPLRFPYVNHALHRDHRKIVVIDGLVAYIGGMNVADYYIVGKPDVGEWRDMHLRLTGDAVGQLQGIFLDFWNRVTRQEVSGPQYYPGIRRAEDEFPQLPPDTTATAGSKRIVVVDRDPATSPRIIHDTFRHAIDSARTQIQIVNPYFTLCPHLRKALKRAVRRGVDVQIMVSETSDIPITPRVVERNARKMMRYGAKVYFYQGGFHHSKILMVDSAYTFLGSANLNARSLSFDYECNLLIDDVCTTRQLQALFERDKQTHCYLLTPERWRKFSWWRRAKGRIFSALIPFL